MVKAYAINTVTICATPGERSSDGKTVKPAVLEDKVAGTVFDCPDDDYEAFEAAGAVRKPTKSELAEAKAAEPAKAAKPADIKNSSSAQGAPNGNAQSGGAGLLGDGSQASGTGSA